MRIREILDQRYAGHIPQLAGQVTTGDTGRLGTVTATVAGQPGVTVKVPMGAAYYPGDTILVEQRGSPAQATYVATGWVSGTRPDAGMLEFPVDSTLGGQNYEAGDLLWGNPFSGHFHLDYSLGHINLRVGLTETGRIDANTGSFMAGNPDGLHGTFAPAGVTFYDTDGTTPLTGWSANAFWVGPAGTSERLVYSSGGLSVTGTITATAGSIGGWVIGANRLADAAGVVGLSAAVTAGDDIRFWAGHATPGSAPFRVTEAGVLTATSATISGAITATSGSITGSLYVGSAAPRIHLDGANKLIESSNYAAGATGFQIAGATGNAEFNNITARGTIKTAVFEKGLVTAFAGSQIVAKGASTVYSAVTLAGTTFDLRVMAQAGAAPFAASDIVRIKTETLDVWVTVNAGSNQTTHWLYTATWKYGSTSGTVEAGAAAVDYGQSGQGYWLVSADGLLGASAAWALRSHAGEPWKTETTHVYAGTDGRLYAGGGDVTLDSAGIRLAYGLGTSKKLSWYDGATEMGSIVIADGMVPGTATLQIDAAGVYSPGIQMSGDLSVAGEAQVRADFASTNSVLDVLTVTRGTIGTAAAGLGGAQKLRLLSTINYTDAAAIEWLWYEATHASRKADLVLKAYDTAVREGLRIRGAGSAAAIGFLGATPAARRAHVADPSGGGTVDAEARSAVNSILATLETFGFHATA